MAVAVLSATATSHARKITLIDDDD
jgi:hypothetical protein